jgi:WD40 repeat protein
VALGNFRTEVWGVDVAHRISCVGVGTLSVTSVAFDPTRESGRMVYSGVAYDTYYLGYVDEANFRQVQNHRRITKVDTSQFKSAMSPLGRKVASWSHGKPVRIMDTRILGETEEFELDSHQNSVDAIAVSDDDGLLLLSSGRTIHAWRPSTRRYLMQLEGHGSSVYAIGLSGASLRAVSAACDSTVRVWCLQSGKELLQIPFEHKDIASVAISLNGDKLAVGRACGAVEIFEVKENSG